MTFSLLTSAANAAPTQSAAPALKVKAAILMDYSTGTILFEQNADALVPPASITKIMTMYIALCDIQKGRCTLTSKVQVSPAAADTEGTRMKLLAHESLPLDTLLTGMAVASGNDASCAVAEFLDGTEEKFVARMNATAAKLGMTNSVFHNAHGLPSPGQLTTARDMLLLSAAYLRRFPQALHYHKQRYMKHNGHVTYNRNPLLGKMEGADGLKTGWVRASGYNIISTVQRGDKRLLAVVLGAKTPQARAHELYRLMEAGFAADQQRSVAMLLPTITINERDLNLDSTMREAYAVLAPELGGRIPHRSYKRAFKGSRNYARARSSHAYAQVSPRAPKKR